MKYKVIHGAQLPKLPKVVGLDIETKMDGTGLFHPAHTELSTVQVAVSTDKVYIVDRGFDQMDFGDSVCVGHNLHFDIQNLKHHCGVTPKKVYDTQVVEGMLDAARRYKSPNHKLKTLVKRYLKRKRDKDIALDFARGSAVTEKMLLYAARDAVDPLKIREKQLEELAIFQPHKILMKLEMAVVPILSGVSYQGMKMDEQKWMKLHNDNLTKLLDIDQECSALMVGSYRRDIFGTNHSSVNLNSHVKLKKLLKANDVDIEDTRRDTLEWAYAYYPHGSKQRRILELLAQRSELQKAVSTYGEKFTRWISPKTGRVHMSWFQTKPETGRLSAGDPNTTNIPVRSDIGKIMRTCFIPEPGHYLIKADYAQQEARIMADRSQDPNLLNAFYNNIDPYLMVARIMFGNSSLEKSDPERDASKIIVLSLFFGAGIPKLAVQLGTTIPEAEGHMRTFKSRFPVVYAYVNDVIYKAERMGYAETVLGRRRWGDPTEPGFTGKMRNHGIQGTAADMLKLGAVILDQRLDRSQAKLINLVHDEMLLETRKEYVIECARITKSSMIDSAECLVDVPFDADISCGFYWGDKSVKIEKYL